MTPTTDVSGLSETDIAIVGMAAHLPGAPDIAAYWQNLAGGVESIRVLSEAELLAAGETPARMRRANYVPSAAVLEGFKEFDAEFFGFSPKEAAILDPQHRHFLEVAWEALENAGHPPEAFKGAIGVYAGCGMGSYFYFNLCSNRDLVDQTGMFLLRHTGNDKDFLSTRVSHILDLKGPSVNVQTACSTSLVAVHYAAQALLSGECDMALAGGVTIELPHARGYLHQEGEILSPDGHCHAFDHRAQGTVFGSGAGCVVLRRAKDAVRDGDHIWAILKGSAINNDGAAKAGYLAPSVDGQAACIAEAQMIAGVSADTVSYVECHGTGTYLGDPIEVAALTQAFAESAETVGTCRIGSVKTNIGHLDTAAGVASLIKVALSLHHRQIPASLGYEAPNPSIDFETSPFRVNDRLTEWHAPLRRAGVNSLGVGGTNAHAVLQEAPLRAASEDSDWPFQPLVISARSKAALDAQAARLAAHLRSHPDQSLADVAWTLKEGRRAFEKRRVIVAESHRQAASLLEGADPRRVFNHDHLGTAPEVIFMFPGGGAQYAGMARDLYETEPVFADWMDRGLAVLEPQLDYDIRALWLPEPGAEAAADAALKRPSVQLPLIMITEFALAKLYESWGVTPGALVGHSMGENTAAALAGVMNFEDCIGLVLLRGQLFDSIAPGGMLSVPLEESVLRERMAENPDLDMASVNAPGLCVVSGPDAALQALAAQLSAEGVETQRIAIDIAAHSRMLEPILERFGAYLRAIPLHAPQLPIVSNRTGQPLTAAEATSPDYWVQHLRNTVNFRACMESLSQPGRVFMEMGPGRALSSLAQANGLAAGQVIAALRHPEQKMADDAWHIATIARLWACGVKVDWAPIWGGKRRLRVPLPTYAFQKKPYFIEPSVASAPQEDPLPERIEDLGQWGWRPHWKPETTSAELEDLPELAPQNWLFFADETGLAAASAARLRQAGHKVTLVHAGDTFARKGSDYILSPERGREGYDLLIRDLVARDLTPQRIAHFWLVTSRESFRPGSSFLHRNIEQGFYSLMFLAQAIADEGLSGPIHLTTLTTGAAQVKAEALPYPEKAMVLGPLRVIPREVPGLVTGSLDLGPLPKDQAPLVERILEELISTPTFAALRGERRYGLTLRPAPLPKAETDLPQGAHVLITGGFGGIGLTLAEDLIRRHGVKITLIARRAMPDRADWPRLLANLGPDDPTARRILALQRLEALGGTLHIAQADVANLVEMQAARDAGEARFGPVHMVIHAAGVVDDGPLLAKTPAEVEEVFAPKLHGTQVLERLFPDGTLAHLILFASTSTVTGPAGQIDYVAANEYLNAYAKSRKGCKTKVLALNWGIWTGVGMAAESLADRVGRPLAPRLPIKAQMLDEAGFDAAGNRIFAAKIGFDRWVLDGHRTKDGTALIPGTGYLELAAEAWRAQGEAGGFELRDLTFFRALNIPEGEAREIRARLTRSDEGYGFDLHSAQELQGRRGWMQHASARLLPLSAAAPSIDPSAIAARLPAPERGEGLQSPQEAHLSFGPRWRVLTSRTTGQGEGLAELSLPESFDLEPENGWLLHPALMDLATGWAMDLIQGYRPDALWVPVSYTSLRAYRALPARILSHIRNAAANSADRPTASFDITLATPEGEVCVEIKGFTIRRLEGALSFPAPDARALEFDETARPLSPAEERLMHSFSQGIRPDEGARAFARALGLSNPQVILSSLDLPALVRQTAGAEAPRAESQSFERPDLDSAYVEPKTEIERRLVGFWQELLGVSRVGVEDSFFDLGGHSLIAVRLFSMVKKAFRVEFPISILFEAPTIAACAKLIADQIGTPEDEAERPTTPARRFTHLVPMHRGEGGAKAPFFLVAGMFGNVLNLRHLAQLLGGDRPFYGLQARGLLGDDTPHDDFTAAARDYIAEMRQVQPQGPYLLGGFSGGGLIAWEIARQLEAAGEEVPLVILLDTPLPLRPSLSRKDKALIKLAELRAKGPGYLLEWARARAAWKRQQAEAPQAQAEVAFHDAAIEAAFRRALPRYDLRLRQGATVLFRPPLDLRWKVSGGAWVSSAKEYVFEDNDLTRFAPALQVFEVPGDHDSMVLEPNVRVLATKMRGVIERAETPAPMAQAAE
ncbi:beta-ketoacyl synthase N-terminal-like domain-containing protein [Xinfangfangia sp. CPCC 101601]|uniref:Beta-ketoacyl synthase N-terminal-like domain-containing protein n=1 Tax=Pseudogemmobacter lacusdianii TaxID=3069608 RepID=A0ABU0VWV2_9RHOB|nr:type I polyketide synthase [Xinfangfangia sp. CPCC 101601]MDQ2066227.1 beta-ketoacyl synthase N-terminal-like domain-containing protein [Xinfangfangia sp. CPCC 101601]